MNRGEPTAGFGSREAVVHNVFMSSGLYTKQSRQLDGKGATPQETLTAERGPLQSSEAQVGEAKPPAARTPTGHQCPQAGRWKPGDLWRP